MNIADAVSADEMRDDRLFQAAKTVSKAKCLPDEARAAIIKHISDARAKHPREDQMPTPAIPDSRPGAARAKVGKAVDKMLAKGAK